MENKKDYPKDNKSRQDLLMRLTEIKLLGSKHFGQFKKTTLGEKTINDPSVDFVVKCSETADKFPEILSRKFDKGDYDSKLMGTLDFFAFKNFMLDILEGWEEDASICKKDTLYYSNEVYSNVKKEAKKDPLYAPTLQALEPYYKKK